MWLINTRSLELEFVVSPRDGSYAVLSHTWGDDEVTFQDIRNDLHLAQSKKGFAKILHACQIAQERHLQYAWVDTCCIDKASSAELSEAINSMFRWYRGAAFCIVFLFDLPPALSSLSSPTSLSWSSASPQLDFVRDFPTCRWLTRGWTLQEMIAPPKLEFYDAGWEFRGYKSDWKLLLSRETGVDVAILDDLAGLPQIPVARRMSWAAGRQTTRIEDMAYCLMGIFDVHMPMIYGEGPKAFVRLQEEIARETSDLSLFAWTQLDSDQDYRGILARSPAEFASCRDLKHRVRNANLTNEFTITNKGLRIETALVDVPEASNDLIWNLGVSHRDDWPTDNVLGWEGIYLARTTDGFVRANPRERFVVEDQDRFRCDSSVMYIRKDVDIVQSLLIGKRFEKSLAIERWNSSVQIVGLAPKQLWDGNWRVFLHHGQGINAYLMLQCPPMNGGHQGFSLIVACSTMNDPICAIWHDAHPLWSDVMNYIKKARQVSDYVAADYLTIHFLQYEDYRPSSKCVTRFTSRPHGIEIEAIVEIRPHVNHGQQGYMLHLDYRLHPP
ncbi:heterokaryon incompatibility protein-domain-containing protein [Xylariaceae sp. FL0016]|nr:heterokaryon incompatibility protein-domain-containing protein [Xylariaceae sp. FL0016]